MRADDLTPLDLAPKRKKPLRWWHPWDYLVLFYWCFFFPQALPWYVETIGGLKEQEPGKWSHLRDHKEVRVLAVMGLVLLMVANVLLNYLGVELDIIDPDDYWKAVAGGVAFGVAVGVAVGVAGGVAVGVAFGVAVGVAVGVAGGVAVGVAFGVAVGVAENLLAGIVAGFSFAFLFPTFTIGTTLRFPDWLLSGPLSGRFNWFSRLVAIPIPALRRRLLTGLINDWRLGAADCHQTMRWSSQHLTAVQALTRALDQSSDREIVKRIDWLARGQHHWDLIRFVAIDPMTFLISMIVTFPLIPPKIRHRLQKKYKPIHRTDNNVRACATGFWCWYVEDASKAREAFEIIRGLPYADFLYRGALAIETASSLKQAEEYGQWFRENLWADDYDQEVLRPETLATIQQLRAIAQVASESIEASSALTRATAFNEVIASLQHFRQNPEALLEPERDLLLEIAGKWTEILTEAAGKEAERQEREPVENPYVGFSGRPVSTRAFAGRDIILANIRRALPATVILYGHRRMGKTSILHRLRQEPPENAHVVLLDMQAFRLAKNNRELLRKWAREIQKNLAKADIPDLPDFQQVDTDYPEEALEDYLEQVGTALSGKSLVLALDEFEYIQAGIEEGRYNKSLYDVIRALTQKPDFQWLSFILAGLHELEEMSGDYQAAFYSQTLPIKVSYLSRKTTSHLVENPDPNFNMRYDPALVDELHRLTFGQPFLLQKICWRLIENWNERFLEERNPPERLLTTADLDDLFTEEFFMGAQYYFKGVWDNITPAERRLLRILAVAPEPMNRTALFQHPETTMSEPEYQQALADLDKHDVIKATEGPLTFAAALMQQWVREYAD